MLENAKTYMRNGPKGKLIALIIILGVSYSLIWQLLEPLNLEFIESHKALWRWILILTTLLITIFVFIFLSPRKNIEQFGFEPSDTNLSATYKSKGNPSITIESDGYHGKVYSLKGVYEKDEMDWPVKHSAHKAQSVSYLYKSSDKFSFYIRVNVLSKDHSTQKPKWIKFDPSASIATTCTDQEEMIYPVLAENQDGFLKTFVNLNKAVSETFGQKGWQFDKLLAIRIRGTVQIKKITLQ